MGARTLRSAAFFGAAFFVFGALLCAAEVTLKDGTRLEGHIGAQGETSLYFVPGPEGPDAPEPRWISLADVESIRLDPVPVTPRTAPQPEQDAGPGR